MGKLGGRQAKAMKEFGEYLLPLVQQKRSQPQDDILSDLSQCFYYFGNEGVYGQLRKQPELIPQADEEMLRYHFIASLDRAVKEDTDVLGVPMKRGEMVIVWITSANRDQRQFANGETFDIHRRNSRDHLSFGNAVCDDRFYQAVRQHPDRRGIPSLGSSRPARFYAYQLADND
ncbi:cytochrome P450 [Brevibacillus choshinensis]|uniref:cytochrome P450 n=1 Tax=Brevibacillus choshinensis TaxID=54911 RepID=UPI002E249133|nr:cytochrome P450 [Brevibacillus choshinensis]MED4782224.1 cytochrome P450 [Brevibacillus choshinensis]